MTTNEQLLTLLLNSKKGADLPTLTSLDNSASIIIYDPSTELVSKILKTDLVIAGGGGSSSKIAVTIDYDGQTVYTISSKPDNIDLSIGRVQQIEGTDYTYSTQTGALTIINASVGSSIKTDTLFDLRGFNNNLAKKEQMVISSSGQSVFMVLEKPKNIDLSLNRTILIEGIDYTYESSTGTLTIINTAYISQITLNSILLARKYY